MLKEGEKEQVRKIKYKKWSDASTGDIWLHCEMARKCTKKEEKSKLEKKKKNKWSDASTGDIWLLAQWYKDAQRRGKRASHQDKEKVERCVNRRYVVSL